MHYIPLSQQLSKDQKQRRAPIKAPFGAARESCAVGRLFAEPISTAKGLVHTTGTIGGSDLFPSSLSPLVPKKDGIFDMHPKS